MDALERQRSLVRTPPRSVPVPPDSIHQQPWSPWSQISPPPNSPEYVRGPGSSSPEAHPMPGLTKNHAQTAAAQRFHGAKVDIKHPNAGNEHGKAE